MLRAGVRRLQWMFIAMASMPVFLGAVPGVSPSGGVVNNFSYSGDTGPGFWDEISSACAATPVSRQSPIDIRLVVGDRRLMPLDLTLDPTSFTLKNPGYTLQATADESGGRRNFLVLNGTLFFLRQFHFHTLSEHTVLGRHTPMELHAVFEDKDAHYAVVGVLYRLGKESKAIDELIEAGLPEKTKSPETVVAGLNLREALTDTASYYTYSGSFTTPPCSEVVTWFLLKNEGQFSLRQYEALRRILGNDFRPTQRLNSRLVRATRR